MFAKAEEYVQQLWLLQSPNMPTKAIILPSDEIIYNIDLNTRTIETPSFLSVVKDQDAETIYFLVDRFFGEVDLATTACFLLYTNNNNPDITKRAGFYPVPFYDVSTFSSHVVENGYEEIHVNSGTYQQNKYYTKEGDNFYLATGVFDRTATYYRVSNASNNKRYVVDNNVTEANYKPGTYYYINPNTGEYVLDQELEYNPYTIKLVYEQNPETGQQEEKSLQYQKTFYKVVSKNFVKTNVDANNYRSKKYYVLNPQTKEMELDFGPFSTQKEYYSIIDKPKILFPWVIGDEATAAAGNLQFSIRFYMIDEDGETLIYNLNTKPSTSKILEGMQVEIKDDEFDNNKNNSTDNPEYQEQIGRQPTILEDLYYKIALKNDIYWIEV